MIKKLLLICLIPFIVISCQDGLQQPVYLYSFNNPAETGSRFPYLFKDNTGTLYMSWLTSIEEDIYALEYAKFKDGFWEVPPAVLVGTNFFVNWADFSSLVAKDGEAVAAHWLRKIDGGPYAYNVQIQFRNPETGRWGDAITPHLDGTPTEHGFVSMQPLSDDKVLAIWLDGRNTDGRGHGEYDDPEMAMTLRSAEVSADGEITRKRVIDAMVCDCCQTDLVPVEDGFVAVYRGRSDGEVRDILISRYSLEEGEWSEPENVHSDGWEISACPVNGPRVVSNGNRVAVAWFTEADDERKVLLARSADGGVTFQEPIVIASGENTIGRADLVFADEGYLYVSWMEQHCEAGHVMLVQVEPDGSLNEPILTGITSSSRSSGFPRIEKMDNEIIIAWTQTEPLVRVRTARVSID
ncbi:MAG: hypothetical protein JJU37_00905 [Balneolaceae bacterium]|nr:hypothetical protein [Balneolaceae bacterium]